MDKRFIFRCHHTGAVGGRRRVDTSGPNGHGSWPVEAVCRREIPCAIGEDGTKVLLGALESSTPHCQEKPRAVMSVWCPYRKPTLVGR
jgi:hypothetical protein